MTSHYDKLYTKEEWDTFKETVHDKLHAMLDPQLVADITVDELVEVYASLPYVHPEMEIREDNLLMTVVFVYLSEIQYKKEGTYGRSFCKRGEMDIFFNMARKFDRLENMMLHDKKDEVGEGKTDTVGDEANYGMLWMTYILREKPELFKNWL